MAGLNTFNNLSVYEYGEERIVTYDYRHWGCATTVLRARLDYVTGWQLQPEAGEEYLSVRYALRVAKNDCPSGTHGQN